MSSLIGSISNSVNKKMVRTLSRDVKKMLDEMPEEQEHEVQTLRLSLSRVGSKNGLDSPVFPSAESLPRSRNTSFNSQVSSNGDFDPRNAEDLEALKAVTRSRKNSITTLEKKNAERDELFKEMQAISAKRFPADMVHVDEQVVAVKRWVTEIERDLDSHLEFNEATGGMKMINKLEGYKKLACKYLALAGEGPDSTI
jgi:hypothetical protein